LLLAGHRVARDAERALNVALERLLLLLLVHEPVGGRNAGYVLHQGATAMGWENVEKPRPSARFCGSLRGAEVEKCGYLRVEGGVIGLYLPAQDLHPEIMVARVWARRELEAAQVEPAIKDPLTLTPLSSDAYPRAIFVVPGILDNANTALQEFDVGECGKSFVRIVVEIGAAYRFVNVGAGSEL
jgi:hypothetical protein